MTLQELQKLWLDEPQIDVIEQDIIERLLDIADEYYQEGLPYLDYSCPYDCSGELEYGEPWQQHTLDEILDSPCYSLPTYESGRGKEWYDVESVLKAEIRCRLDSISDNVDASDNDISCFITTWVDSIFDNVVDAVESELEKIAKQEKDSNWQQIGF